MSHKVTVQGYTVYTVPYYWVMAVVALKNGSNNYISAPSYTIPIVFPTHYISQLNSSCFEFFRLALYSVVRVWRIIQCTAWISHSRHPYLPTWVCRTAQKKLTNFRVRQEAKVGVAQMDERLVFWRLLECLPADGSRHQAAFITSANTAKICSKSTNTLNALHISIYRRIDWIE